MPGNPIASLFVQIGGDLQNLKSGLKQAEGITTAASKALSIAAGAAAVGFGALAAEIGFAVKAASESEKVNAQLDAVLKSTKNAAGLTATEIRGMAGALQRMTPFEDDAIISGQNLLLTFTKISKDVFPGATETMLDMSAALGQDLKSSALQLGKALNDPIEGVSALRRVGVSFTDAQEKQIKALVESGNLLGAQKLVLAELQTEFGGAAKAAGGTFAGQMQILQNQIGDVQETIGGAFLPTLKEMVGWVKDNLVPAFAKFAEENVPKIQAALKQFGEWLQKVGIPAFQQFARFIQENAPKIQAAIVALWDDIQPAFIAFKAWLETDGVKAIQTFIREMQTLAPMVAEWKTIVTELRSFLSNTFGQIKTDSNENWFDISRGISDTFANIRATITNALAIIREIQNTWQALTRGDWFEFADSIGVIFARVWRFTLPGMIDAAAQFLGNKMAELAWSMLGGLVRGLLDNAASVYNTLSSIIDKAIAQIKSRLGIHSPSTVFAEMGVNMAAGLVRGFGVPQLNFAGTIASSADTGSRASRNAIASTSIGQITIQFNGANAPRTEREAEKSANLFVDALRAKGIGV